MRSTTFTTVSTLALAVGVAYAQDNSSITGISDSCSNAITGIATNSDAADCLWPNALISIFASNSSQSLVGPINNWLDGVCGAPACSDDTLSAIVANITSGCEQEFSLFGITSENADQITNTVQDAYPTVRQVLCLQQGDELCASEALSDFEETYGTLSIDNIGNWFIGGIDTSRLPQNATCTDCTKEAYNILSEKYPDYVSESDVQAACGDSFVDGNTPSGVTRGASQTDSEGGGGDGAMTLSSFKNLVQTMFALSGAALVLA